MDDSNSLASTRGTLNYIQYLLSIFPRTVIDHIKVGVNIFDLFHLVPQVFSQSTLPNSFEMHQTKEPLARLSLSYGISDLTQNTNEQAEPHEIFLLRNFLVAQLANLKTRHFSNLLMEAVEKLSHVNMSGELKRIIALSPYLFDQSGEPIKTNLTDSDIAAINVKIWTHPTADFVKNYYNSLVRNLTYLGMSGPRQVLTESDHAVLKSWILPYIRDAITHASGYIHNSVPSPVGGHVHAKYVEIIEQPEHFALLRGVWGKDCCSVPYYALLKNATVFAIYNRPVPRPRRPTGYVFAYRIQIGNEIVPYVITVNGPRLSDHTPLAVLKLVAENYQAKRIIIPSKKSIDHLINSAAVIQSFESLSSEDISVTLDAGWDVVDEFLSKLNSGLTPRYHQSNLKDARIVSMDDPVMKEFEQRSSPVDFAPASAASLVDTSHNSADFFRSDFQMAFLIAMSNAEQSKGDLSNLLHEYSVTEAEYRAARSFYRVESDFSYDVFLDMKRLFKFSLDDFKFFGHYMEAVALGKLLRDADRMNSADRSWLMTRIPVIQEILIHRIANHLDKRIGLPGAYFQMVKGLMALPDAEEHLRILIMDHHPHEFSVSLPLREAIRFAKEYRIKGPISAYPEALPPLERKRSSQSGCEEAVM